MSHVKIGIRDVDKDSLSGIHFDRTNRAAFFCSAINTKNLELVSKLNIARGKGEPIQGGQGLGLVIK